MLDWNFSDDLGKAKAAIEPLKYPERKNKLRLEIVAQTLKEKSV